MKIIKIMIFALVISAISLTSYPVSAAVTSAEQSQIIISFDPNTDPTPPVNPDNPGTESGESGTDANGPLSIDYISSFSFGSELSISSNQQIYKSVTPKPYIQITDNRGTGGGWKVKASASSFKQDTIDTLRGSYITLSNGSPLSVNPALTPPSAEQSVVLMTDGETEVLVITAALGEGMGTWVNRWYPATGPNTHVTLTVPGGVATIGAHTAVITWELTDAP